MTRSFTSRVWITNSCLVTGHALAANLTPQSAVDSIESVVNYNRLHLSYSTYYVKNYVLALKNITKNIYVEKTYYIRKVGGGGGRAEL